MSIAAKDTERRASLASFFFGGTSRGTGQALEVCLQSDKAKGALKPVQASILTGAPGLLSRALKRLLDVKIEQLLAEGLKKARELGKLCDADGEVALVDYSVATTHRPRIRIELAGQSVEIAFEAIATLKIDAIRLQVTKGRITSLDGLRIGGDGSISVEGEKVYECDFPKWEPGLTISLGDGIAIPRVLAPAG